MPRPFRGAGTIGVALTAWDIWRRIPPRQRKLLLAQAKTHGPRIVKTHGPNLVKRAYGTNRKPRD